MLKLTGLVVDKITCLEELVIQICCQRSRLVCSKSRQNKLKITTLKIKGTLTVNILIANNSLRRIVRAQKVALNATTSNRTITQ